ncbi:MAG: cation:proton antiporter [Moraxellaceae bacterium]
MESLSFAFFLIFAGAAVLATLALYSRQPLIMAYIVLGALIGPYGFALVTDVGALQQMASVGIMFLLFLLGLDMQPSALAAVLKKASWVTVLSSLLFFGAGYGVAIAFGFTGREALIVGLALINSSTIIGLKLLPTTVLHHKHMGELMIGLLLLQDFIALFILIALDAMAEGGASGLTLLRVVAGLPLLVLAAWLLVKYVLIRLYEKFDRFHEYLFLMTIGWCLGVAQLAHVFGLSAETGAFIAGITLASHPVSQYLAINLRPLRDFFLILFFFALGAGFDASLLPKIWLPALVLTVLVVAGKPVVFRYLLARFSESASLAWDVGFRLGQISEFSLLIAFMALSSQLIGKEAAHVIEATAILTFVISSYIVVFNYPNPIAVSEHLRRD